MHIHVKGGRGSVDSGTFFEGGTTEVVAEMIQCRVQSDDPALEAAIRAALGWG